MISILNLLFVIKSGSLWSYPKSDLGVVSTLKSYDKYDSLNDDWLLGKDERDDFRDDEMDDRERFGRAKKPGIISLLRNLDSLEYV